METWTQPAWTPSPLPWPAPFSAWTSAPRPAKNKFRNYIPCLCLGYQMREAFPPYLWLLASKGLFQWMKNHFRGQSARWFHSNHTHTSALQSYFTRFSFISLKFRYHYVASVCPKHNWKTFKFDKANFPDLGPTVISDQIFSHILKAPDDVKQNHLSHSLSLYSIKFQQENLWFSSHILCWVILSLQFCDWDLGQLFFWSFFYLLLCWRLFCTFFDPLQEFTEKIKLIVLCIKVYLQFIYYFICNVVYQNKYNSPTLQAQPGQRTGWIVLQAQC